MNHSELLLFIHLCVRHNQTPRREMLSQHLLALQDARQGAGRGSRREETAAPSSM